MKTRLILAAIITLTLAPGAFAQTGLMPKAEALRARPASGATSTIDLAHPGVTKVAVIPRLAASRQAIVPAGSSAKDPDLAHSIPAGMPKAKALTGERGAQYTAPLK